MMFSLLRIGVAMVSAAAALVTAGCAKPFPERLNWHGGDPNLYSRAFNAAGQEAVAKALTGQNYYELLGDAAYQLSMDGLCDRDKFDAYFFQKTRACFLIGGPPLPDCANLNGCAALEYDPTLLSDLRIRTAVEAALRDPCRYLTPPDQVKYPAGVARFFMSANDNWRIMLCDGPGVFGKDITFDEGTGRIRVQFERGN